MQLNTQLNLIKRCPLFSQRPVRHAGSVRHRQCPPCQPSRGRMHVNLQCMQRPLKCCRVSKMHLAPRMAAGEPRSCEPTQVKAGQTAIDQSSTSSQCINAGVGYLRTASNQEGRAEGGAPVLRGLALANSSLHRCRISPLQREQGVCAASSAWQSGDR